MNDELEDYNDWIQSNEGNILERYIEEIVEFPEHIYEGILDDDYQNAEETYLEGITLEDVTDDFIIQLYDEYLECGN